jgi:hypothetical protein
MGGSPRQFVVVGPARRDKRARAARTSFYDRTAAELTSLKFLRQGF